MLTGRGADLLASLTEWVGREKAIQAAVLFGSKARDAGAPAASDVWSDVDLHVVTNAADRIERLDWASIFPAHRFCLRVVRPATGGVRKITILFEEGEADLVLIPVRKLKIARLAVGLGLHRKLHSLRASLENLSTVMRGGYRFIKGEKDWGRFYEKGVGDLRGFRISDDEACQLADVFLCELLWVFQKLERGELIAAQRILHRSLLETNVVLLHERRQRRATPSFQQARRIERLATPEELDSVLLNSRLDSGELLAAGWRLQAGLSFLMRDLSPKWSIPAQMDTLLAPYRKPKL